MLADLGDQAQATNTEKLRQEKEQREVAKAGQDEQARLQAEQARLQAREQSAARDLPAVSNRVTERFGFNGNMPTAFLSCYRLISAPAISDIDFMQNIEEQPQYRIMCEHTYAVEVKCQRTRKHYVQYADKWSENQWHVREQNLFGS